MKKNITLIAFVMLMGGGYAQNPTTLKEALADKFLIGTAINVDQLTGKDSLGQQVILQQFNAVVAENCMKAVYLQPVEGKFYFDEADKLVEFAQQNDLTLTVHCLVSD